LLDALVGFVAGLLATALAARLMLARRLQRQRAAERRARAAERMAEIGAMTSGLAHEIRNPLSTIGLNAQLLAEGLDALPIDEENESRLTRRTQTLLRETERLRGILEDFLQYAGQIHLSRARLDLNELADELVDFFAPQAEQQGVRLRPDLAPVPLPVLLDAKLVKQAVLNLLLNAAEAMSETQGQRELILRTRASTDADGSRAATLHVIDTGPGMDEQTRARVFEPYFSTKPAGTGLGLPITRRVVEAHGGRIEIHSDLGRGTDFALIFPLADPPPDPEEHRAESSAR